MAEVNLIKYPVGLLLVEDDLTLCRTANDNLILQQHNKTLHCCLKDPEAENVLLALGHMEIQEFVDLCARNCSGRLRTGEEFFG